MSSGRKSTERKREGEEERERERDVMLKKGTPLRYYAANKDIIRHLYFLHNQILLVRYYRT